MFISHRAVDSEAVKALRAELAAHDDWISTWVEDVASGVVPERGIGEAIAAADAVIVMLPAADSEWVRYEVGAARARGKPVVLVETPGSTAAGVGVWDQPTIRWNLRDVTPILRAVQMALRGSQTAEDRKRTSNPALSAAQANHWEQSIRMAKVDRFERQVTMMLSDSGLDLSTPDEAGADLVAWSDDTATLLGNPFGIEIKRVLTPDVVERAESWLARSGVSSLLVLVGEGHDASVISTDLGRLILVVAATDLVGELRQAPFADAVRALALRAGVRL
ncbi:MAG: TIR domain-containing protein [Actinomycetota bacterium]|nr:TIR domain-containing protein [Actinomycetota bacterium]